MKMDSFSPADEEYIRYIRSLHFSQEQKNMIALQVVDAVKKAISTEDSSQKRKLEEQEQSE